MCFVEALYNVGPAGSKGEQWNLIGITEIVQIIVSYGPENTFTPSNSSTLKRDVWLCHPYLVVKSSTDLDFTWFCTLSPFYLHQS